MKIETMPPKKKRCKIQPTAQSVNEDNLLYLSSLESQMKEMNPSVCFNWSHLFIETDTRIFHPKGRYKYHCVRNALNNLFQLDSSSCITPAMMDYGQIELEHRIVKGIFNSMEYKRFPYCLLKDETPNLHNKKVSGNWDLESGLALTRLVFSPKLQWKRICQNALFSSNARVDSPNDYPMFILEVYTEEEHKRKSYFSTGGSDDNSVTHIGQLHCFSVDLSPIKMCIYDDLKKTSIPFNKQSLEQCVMYGVHRIFQLQRPPVVDANKQSRKRKQKSNKARRVDSVEAN